MNMLDRDIVKLLLDAEKAASTPELSPAEVTRLLVVIASMEHAIDAFKGHDIDLDHCAWCRRASLANNTRAAVAAEREKLGGYISCAAGALDREDGGCTICGDDDNTDCAVCTARMHLARYTPDAIRAAQEDDS